MTPQDQLQQPKEIDLDSAVEQLRQKFSVPKVLVDRMVQQESGGNTKAVSPVGARGRFQVMPGTISQISRETGKNLDNNNPLDNAYAGLYLLKQNYDKFRKGAPSERGAWMRAVAGYHAGAGNVEKDLRSGGVGIPDVGDGLINTRDHVYTIFNGTKSEDFGDQPSQQPIEIQSGMIGERARVKPRGQPARGVSMVPGMGAARLISRPRTGMSAARVEGEAQPSAATQGRQLIRKVGGPVAQVLSAGVVNPNALPTDLGDFVGQGAADAAKGLMERGAGIALQAPGLPMGAGAPVAEKIRSGARQIGEASAAMDTDIQRSGVNVPVLGRVSTKDVQNLGSQAVATAPALALQRLGVPAPIAFGLDAYLASTGRGDGLETALKEAGLGAATGGLYEIPLPRAAKATILRQIGAKLGLGAAGGYGLAKAFGVPEEEARKNAAVTALFMASGVKPEERPNLGSSKPASITPILQEARAERVNEALAGTKPAEISPEARYTPRPPLIEPAEAERVRSRVSLTPQKGAAEEVSRLRAEEVANRAAEGELQVTDRRRLNATPPRKSRIAPAPEELRPLKPATSEPQKPAEIPSVKAASTPSPSAATAPRPEIGERAFQKSAKAAGLPQGTDLTYAVNTDIGAVERANQRIQKGGSDKVAQELLNTAEPSKDDIITGSIIAHELTAKGDIAGAVDMVDDMARKLTNAGQTSQAASVIARLSPEGVLMSGQRRMPRGEKLTEKQGAQLIEMATKIKESESKLASLEQRILEMKTPRAKPSRIGTLEDRLVKMEMDARARLVARQALAVEQTVGPRGQRGSGANPAGVALDIGDYAIIGAAKLARKGVTLAKWTDEMVKEFGEEIRPRLKAIYRESYKHYDDQRKQFTQESRERGARRAEPNAKDIQRVINERLAAQKEAQKARRELTQTFEQLSRTRLQKVAQGTTGFRRANLLTAAKTLIRNVPSNALHMASEGVSRPIAAMADMMAMRVKKTGVRTTTALSIPAEVRATYDAVLKEGPRRAADIILGREVLPLEGYGKQKESLGSKMQMEKSDTGIKLLDFYIDKVFAAQGAVDAPFKIYAFSRELADIAKSQAMTERISDRSINVTRRAKELRANPTDAMLMEASAYADFATFQNDNTVSKGIRSGKRMVGTLPTFAIEQIAPFDRTPTNILYRTFENSPLGFISAANKFRNIGNVKGRELSGLKTPRAQAKGVANAISDAAFTRAEQKEFARTFGRAGTGTILAGLAVGLAAKGLLIGSSDYDDDKAAYFRKRHNYGGGAMLKVPGTSQYVYIGDTPAGKAMATVAAMYEQIADEKKSADQKVTGSVKSVGNLALDQPLMQGTSDLLKGKSLSESAGSYGATYIPGSAALRQIGEIADPEARKSFGEGFGAQFKIVSPYHRRGLPVNKGINRGERGSVGRRVLRSLDPFNATTEGRGPVTVKPMISKPRSRKLQF